MRIPASVALLLCIACAASAQPAAEKGTPLGNVKVNVNGNVSAQAVLIPRVNARRIFGDEIANNYAVIEVNISNKSPDAALLIHGIFIDYSDWPMSGMSRADLRNLDRPEGPFADYQGTTRPSQVASEEYRVVRGQLLDAQMWTKRNLVMRVLTLAGSLASAYTFSLKEDGIIKGITQATGVGIPGVATAWPDSTVEQLNRVSDFGYRANQVVPRKGSEIVVCFFPIDRFLTPGFRRLFLRSPALFFAPLQMLADAKTEKEVTAALGKDLGLEPRVFGVGEGGVVRKLRGQLPCYLRIVRGSGPNRGTLLDDINPTADAACLSQFGLVKDSAGVKLVDNSDATAQAFAGFMALHYIKEMSLNKVGVTVDGVMSVDTAGLAAKAEGIEFDQVAGCNGGPETECFWTNTEAGGGVRTGRIIGSYMTGGTVVFKEADGDLKEVATVAEGSDDQHLGFSFKLAKFLPAGTKLHYRVTKPKAEGAGTLDSPEREYVVNYTPGPPVLAKPPEVSGDNKAVTITGTGFIPGATSVVLTSPDGQQLEGDDVKMKSPATPTKVEVDMTGRDLGCWTAEVYTGEPRKLANPGAVAFALLPTPTVEGAEVKGKQVVVTGKQLVDTGTCNRWGGKLLSFQLVKKEPSVTDKPVALVPEKKLAEKWEFKLPAAAAEADSGPWVVQAWHGTKKVGEPVELKR